MERNCLGTLGCLGGMVLSRAWGFFRLSGNLFKEWGFLSPLAKVMVKMQPILVLEGSHFGILGQTRAAALFALPFFPFLGADMVAVESGFSVCPRPLVSGTFLGTELWVGVLKSLPSPDPSWVR